MEMLAIVLSSAVILTIAYFTYGRWLARMFRLDDRTPTPANTMRDDVDYAPCPTGPLLNQHFSAIAAAGPIVGPILAGYYFGWLPALIWILIGSILIGGVHDFSALVASIRHKGLSILEVVKIHISGRAYLLFLTFVWLALVYILVAFTDITASMFVGAVNVGDGEVFKSMAEVKLPVPRGTVLLGGIATSSLIYLVLPMIMGLLVRSGVLSMGKATWIFLPLVGVAIGVGQFIPLNVDTIIKDWYPSLTSAQSVSYAVCSWVVFLLVYCAIASVVPMWLLLQPRGQLGGYFLYAALGAGALGILMGGTPIEQDMFKGFVQEKGNLFPFLFITIACGACSGFHSLIASGTTSKQLKLESHARPIGYGAMLLEAMVAIVSLCCVMMLTKTHPLLLSSDPSPGKIYANGIGTFLENLYVPLIVGVPFAFMAFNTFVYDTLDVCTRLGRYIIQELTGWKNKFGMWLGTLLTVGVPMLFVLQRIIKLNRGDEDEPTYIVFWKLFGASNQLLAALTLLSVTVWLWRTRQAVWVFFVTGIPAVFMYVMSSWALVTIVQQKFAEKGITDPVAWISVVLLVLAALMLFEGIAALLRRNPTSGDQSPPMT